MIQHSQFDNLLDDSNDQVDDAALETDPTELSRNDDDSNGSEADDNIEEEEDTLDAFSSFLKSRGVRDGKTLVYENEDTGDTEEVDFNTLSKEEQVEILNSIADPGLTEDEIETINYLRKNNTSLSDVIAHYKEEAVNEYLSKNEGAEKSYAIDDYSDDELYIADQKSKFPEMTDEELQIELELAKSNDGLFKKKAEAIRKQYKTIEENHIKEAEETEKSQREAYQNQFVSHLNDFDSISLDYKDPKSDALLLEEHDKSKIFDYVFKEKADGTTQFIEDLTNPEVIMELAWYRLFGKDAMSDISKYWKDELKKVRKPEPQKPITTVTQQTTNTNRGAHTLSSAWDKLL